MTTKTKTDQLTKMERNSDEKYCHSCANVVHIEANACPKCGAPQQSAGTSGQISTHNNFENLENIRGDQIYCVGCGHIMHATALSCPCCGAVNTNIQKKGSKDRVAAGLFALLLGGLGAHHFYLGNIGLGILYFIFSWTLIPMIIGFIEGIVYLSQSDESFARKHH